MTFVLPVNLVHVMFHTHRQWLPGDNRGFRSRKHRIHSSGDYKHPPPAEEHAGLHDHVQSNMTGPAVKLTAEQREAVGLAMIFKLQKMGCEVLILSCGANHVHALMSPSERNVRKQMGKAKQFASLKCPGLSGQIWGEMADVEPVIGRVHARRVFRYIRDHIDEDAWVWRFDRDAPPTKEDVDRVCGKRAQRRG